MNICILLPVNLCEMKNQFPAYEKGLGPQFKFLSDKAVIIQAWKKAHEYIRRHNWYSDNFELDISCIELEKLYLEIQALFSDKMACRYCPSPMRLVLAPKADNNGLRPLAHLAVRDQTVAMMFLMCLANIVEHRQGRPMSYGSLNNPTDVVSYGNRLFMSSSERDGEWSFLWGNAETYNRYYLDYQNFIMRPNLVPKRMSENGRFDGCDFYEITLDITKFYDCIKRDVLISKIIKEIKSVKQYDEYFIKALKSLFRWSWDENVTEEEYRDNGLPQGLAASGFFANIYLLAFDDFMKSLFNANLKSCGEECNDIVLVDYCRYVDDMRLVVAVNHDIVFDDATLNVVRNTLETKLKELCPGLRFNQSKASYKKLSFDNNVDFVSMIVGESRECASGAMGESDAAELLDLNHRLWKAAEEVSRGKKSSLHMVEDPWIRKIGKILVNRNKPAMKDESIERFAANNWRRAYRSLTSMLPDFQSNDYESIGGCEGISLDTINKLTDEFCEDIFSKWFDDPSKIRILRIAFDLRPNPKYLREVLEDLLIKITKGGDSAKIGFYVAAELYRAGAIETGFAYAKADGKFYEQWLEYRRVLHEYVVRFDAYDVPWMLANQLMLFELCFAKDEFSFLYKFFNTCDKVYQDCAEIICGRNMEVQRTLSVLALAYNISKNENVLTLVDECADAQKDEISRHICEMFLCSDDSSENKDCIEKFEIENERRYCLRDIMLQHGNLFDNEVSILRLGIALCDFIKNEKVNGSHFFSPKNIAVECSDWGGLSESQNDRVKIRVFLHETAATASSREFLFCPEPWESRRTIKMAQVGKILRAVIMKDDEYSLMRKESLTVACANNEEYRTFRYYGVRSTWLKRKYGLCFDRSQLGGVFVAFSPWFNELLSEILSWPGVSFVRKHGKLNLKLLRQKFINRLGELSLYPRLNAETVFVPVDIDLDKFMSKSKESRKVVNVAMVQGLHPNAGELSDSERNKVSVRKQAKRHLSDLISLLKVAFKTHCNLMSRDKSINLVIFSELSVYEQDVGMLRRFADKMNCIVFCGLVYCNDPRKKGGLINAGLWIIPQQKGNDSRRIFIELLQGKANLASSESEVSGLSSYRPVQWIVRGISKSRRHAKPIWSMSASICYDATDIQLAAALRNHIDCYIVAAFNKDVGLFDAMAESWRYHMYGHTIVTNTGNYGGSTIQAPYEKNYERVIAHTHGGNQAQIIFSTLDFGLFEKKKIGKNRTKRQLRKHVKTSPAGYEGRIR